MIFVGSLLVMVQESCYQRVLPDDCQKISAQNKHHKHPNKENPQLVVKGCRLLADNVAGVS